MLGITVAGRAILSHPFGGDDTASTTTQNPSTVSGTQSTPASGAGTTTASGSTEIAQVSAVQPNSAVTFTIPSNGDPGVLIHLNNGKFVAFDATCTHAGCPVQYDPSSQHLLCPCHGAEFDPSQCSFGCPGAYKYTTHKCSHQCKQFDRCDYTSIMLQSESEVHSSGART